MFFYSGQSCCWMIRVWYSSKTEATTLHADKLGYYKMEPGLVRGRPHYTSIFANGMYAIAFCGTHWNVQRSSERGQCRGFLTYPGRNNQCPHYPAYSWQYYIYTTGKWENANRGVSIWCKS